MDLAHQNGQRRAKDLGYEDLRDIRDLWSLGISFCLHCLCGCDCLLDELVQLLQHDGDETVIGHWCCWLFRGCHVDIWGVG